jgi:hypothetical protein
VIRAPDPATHVRRTLTPPDDLAIPMPPMICAATAWRRDIRARARRTRLSYAASLALSVLLLSVWVWTYHALPPPEATTVARAVAR